MRDWCGHLDFISVEEYDKIVLLYQLEQGQADRSYGLNVAALAGLSSDILRVAAQKAKELQAAVYSDKSQHLSHLNPSHLSAFKSIMKLPTGQNSLLESLSSVLGALWWFDVCGGDVNWGCIQFILFRMAIMFFCL